MESSEKRVRPLAADALVLFAIFWLSAAPYVFKLGFYSDDWGFLWMFHSADPGGGGFTRVLQEFPGRPLAALLHALLYAAFDSHPFGYHLVNTTILAAADCLLYLLLVRLKFSRAEALAVALVLIALPQLSTVRAWSAASAVNLSLLLALVSLHAQLSFDRTGRIGWAGAALAAAILSLAAYEIFGPFLVAFPIAMLVNRRLQAGKAPWRGLLPAVAAIALVSAIGVLLKVLTSGRAGPIGDLERYRKGALLLFDPSYDWRSQSGLNIYAAAEVHFWRPLAGWAQSVRGLVSWQHNAVALGSAVAAVALYFLLLAPAFRNGDDLRPRRLVWLGFVTFLLGHATFLIVPAIKFTPSGMGNRVLVAGAIGVAMIAVALIGWIAGAAPAVWRARCFQTLIGLLLFCGVLRVATVASFWADAPRLQQKILSAAGADLQAIPPGSTVILDGVCPYLGPAPVFETSWDVAGALSIVLNHPLAGDAVSPRMRLTPKGLYTSTYKLPSLYPFDPKLFVYNPNLHLVVPLARSMDAQRYFARPGRWPIKCPPSYVAHGVSID